jgi:RNase P subunit RPR2
MTQMDCKHHFRIETPDGETVVGTCRNCGLVKYFRTAWPDEHKAFALRKPRKQ